MSKHVGIIGNNNPESALYCRVQGDGYWVVNGEWLLGFDGKIHDGTDTNFMKYRIVLDRMEDMYYQDACDLISKAYNGDEQLKGSTHEEYTDKLANDAENSIGRLPLLEMLKLVNPSSMDKVTKYKLKKMLKETILSNSNQALNTTILETVAEYEDKSNCPKCMAKHSMELNWGGDYCCNKCRNIEYENDYAF